LHKSHETERLRHRYQPARTPNGNPRWQLYPEGYSFDCAWGDDMEAADGISFNGGNLTDLCQHGSVGLWPCGATGGARRCRGGICSRRHLVMVSVLLLVPEKNVLGFSPACA